jgi:hypothetical protein
MANAEKLLHEAQYAFQSISFGETPDNRRNASRALSLCKKIIRKYPASMEASEAHAILRRLGEEAYSSKMSSRHRHVSQATHHQAPSRTRTPMRTPTPEQQRTFVVHDEIEALDWGALVKLIFTVPKYVLGLIVFVSLFLFGLFGPLLFVPLVAFVLFTGPFRQMLKQEQRNNLNTLVQRINALVAERHSGVS